MFSKKVEEFDEVKHNLAVKDREFNQVKIERTNMDDYHVKFERSHH
jgi:hypothetical protein